MGSCVTLSSTASRLGTETERRTRAAAAATRAGDASASASARGGDARSQWVRSRDSRARNAVVSTSESMTSVMASTPSSPMGFPRRERLRSDGPPGAEDHASVKSNAPRQVMAFMDKSRCWRARSDGCRSNVARASIESSPMPFDPRRSVSSRGVARKPRGASHSHVNPLSPRLHPRKSSVTSVSPTFPKKSASSAAPNAPNSSLPLTSSSRKYLHDPSVLDTSAPPSMDISTFANRNCRTPSRFISQRALTPSSSMAQYEISNDSRFEAPAGNHADRSARAAAVLKRSHLLKLNRFKSAVHRASPVAMARIESSSMSSS